MSDGISRGKYGSMGRVGLGELGNVQGEASSALGQSVEGGGRNLGVSVATEVIGTKAINGYEEDIGFGRFWGLVRSRRW